MNKKIFIGLLFLISLMVLAGGCGGGHSGSATSETEVDAALKGAWLSSNGSATIASTNEDSDDLEEFEAAFGEIPEEVLKKYREKYQAERTKTTVTAPVTRAMVFFENCDISKSSGTAKLTGVVIVSDDSLYLPIYFNGVTLSTTRGSDNTWTAATPNGGTLTIKMDSQEKMTLSGKVSYLDYNCEFSTTIEKGQSNPTDPEKILEGTWSLDGTQSGGVLVYGSEISAAAVPETASMSFEKNDTNNSLNVASSHVLRVKTSGTEDEDSTALLQKVNPASESTLTKVSDNVYKLKDASGSENIIFIENTDQIFVIKNENEDDSTQTSVFLPLKKTDWDIETLLNKNWSASENDGGGYIRIDDMSTLVDGATPEELEFLEILRYISLTLKSASFSFSGITQNEDGTITAKMNISAALLITSENLKPLLTDKLREIEITDSGSVIITKAGNSFTFEKKDDENGSDIYNASFISENELALSVKSGEEGVGVVEFFIKFKAN